MNATEDSALATQTTSATAATREADELVANGRPLEALDLLVALNLSRPTFSLERRIIELRRDAFEQLEHSAGRQVWPPEYGDPFPGVDGLCEVDITALDAALVGGAIQHHGCLLVRGFFDERTAARLVEQVDDAFAAQSKWRDRYRGRWQRVEIADRFVPFQPSVRYPVAHLDMGRMREDFFRVQLVDAPSLAFEVTQAFDAAGLRAVVDEYFGDRAALSVNKWTARKLPPKPSVQWHQESFYVGDGVRALNVWTSLTPAGRDASGLDILPVRLRETAHPARAEGRTMTTEHLTSGEVAEIGGGIPSARPDFQAGDALLFDQHLIHRTAFDESMKDTRYSIESWFFAPTGYPLDFGPIVY